MCHLPGYQQFWSSHGTKVQLTMWFMWCRCMRNCHGPVELCSIRWCPRPSFWIPPLGQCSRRLPWLRLGWTLHGNVFNCGLGQAASNKARMKSSVRSHGQRCNQVHEAIIARSWSRKPIWFSPLLIAMLWYPPNVMVYRYCLVLKSSKKAMVIIRP